MQERRIRSAERMLEPYIRHGKLNEAEVASKLKSLDGYVKKLNARIAKLEKSKSFMDTLDSFIEQVKKFIRPERIVYPAGRCPVCRERYRTCAATKCDGKRI